MHEENRCVIRTLFTGTAVVGRLAGDGDVVRMALQYTGTCDAGELGIVKPVSYTHLTLPTNREV